MSQKLIDAFNELHEIIGEAEKLQEAITSEESSKQMTDATNWIFIQGFASAIEKIYTGCERVLELVAKQVDMDPIPKSNDWHRQLLLRMKNELSGVRPAVLSASTYKTLNDFRSFRHRQRNSYGSDLDSVRVMELAKEAVKLPKMLKADLEILKNNLGS